MSYYMSQDISLNFLIHYIDVYNFETDQPTDIVTKKVCDMKILPTYSRSKFVLFLYRRRMRTE